MCYLKGVIRLDIVFKNHGHTHIECFTDVEWDRFKIKRRSTTSYCVFVGGNLVLRKSKNQTIASHSSAESEYKLMTQSTCKILWIYHLLYEVDLKPTSPVKL